MFFFVLFFIKARVKTIENMYNIYSSKTLLSSFCPFCTVKVNRFFSQLGEEKRRSTYLSLATVDLLPISCDW